MEFPKPGPHFINSELAVGSLATDSGSEYLCVPKRQRVNNKIAPTPAIHSRPTLSQPLCSYPGLPAALPYCSHYLSLTTAVKIFKTGNCCSMSYG